VAARSCAGTLALVYVPDRRTVELDLSVMRSVATLTWIDPTTGATRPAEPPTAPTDTRLELSTPGDNAEGSTDWLLEVRAA
jgi:hypothetical protein